MAKSCGACIRPVSNARTTPAPIIQRVGLSLLAWAATSSADEQIRETELAAVRIGFQFADSQNRRVAALALFDSGWEQLPG